MRRFLPLAALLGVAGLIVGALLAAPTPPPAYNPPVAEASDEGAKAMACFRVLTGVTTSTDVGRQHVGVQMRAGPGRVIRFPDEGVTP